MRPRNTFYRHQLCLALWIAASASVYGDPHALIPPPAARPAGEVSAEDPGQLAYAENEKAYLNPKGKAVPAEMLIKKLEGKLDVDVHCVEKKELFGLVKKNEYTDYPASKVHFYSDAGKESNELAISVGLFNKDPHHWQPTERRNAL